MPGMPRISGKAKKIAYKILGTPANQEKKQPKRKRKIQKRLVFEETILSR